MQARLEDRDSPLVTIFARLAGGITASAATAQLRVLETQLNRENVRRQNFSSPVTAKLVRGITNTGERESVRTVVTLLFDVVGALLLICCVNVGNLLLVRGASRQREVAIRYALGATRSRIVQQFLTDSFVLAALGGMGGLLVNTLFVRLIVGLLPALPLGENISPDVPLDWRVIGFVGASALASVFLFGLLPAWKASSAKISAKIGSSLATVRGVRLRRSSVVAQVALSFVLLVLAGLFLNTCWQLQHVNPGFAVRDRIYATTYISKPEFTAQQIPGFYQRVLTNVSAMRGVRSAGLTYLLPLAGPETDCVTNSNSSKIDVTTSTISPAFLSTMNISILQGRDFDESDESNTQSVVLINQLLAQKLWPNMSALGKKIQLGCSEPSAAIVIGVVNNSKTASLTQPVSPHVYRAFAQNATGLANIVIDTSEPPESMIGQLRRILLSQGHGMRVYAVNPLAQHVEQSYWQLRWESWLLGAFGAVALLLAALGLYGVISYSTALRTKEFGVRMALGAQPGDILRLVMREGIILGISGICIGSAIVFGVAGYLRNYLLTEHASVPFACLGVALLWLLIGIGACYLPARRSSHVLPSTTLRYE